MPAREVPVNRQRLLIYAVLLVICLAVAVSGRAFLDSLNVHDYSARHADVDPGPLRLSESEFAGYIPAALEIRIDQRDGRLYPVLQWGACVLARRSSQGVDVGGMDAVVAIALAELAEQSWMKEFADREMQSFWSELQTARTDGSIGAEQGDLASIGESLTSRFSERLAAQPRFREEFKAALERAADRLRKEVEWDDPTQP